MHEDLIFCFNSQVLSHDFVAWEIDLSGSCYSHYLESNVRNSNFPRICFCFAQNSPIRQLTCDQNTPFPILKTALILRIFSCSLRSHKNSEAKPFYVVHKEIFNGFQDVEFFMRQQADQECGGSLGKNLSPAIFDPTCRSRDPSWSKGHDLYCVWSYFSNLFSIQKMDAHFQEAGKCLWCASQAPITFFSTGRSSFYITWEKRTKNSFAL